LAQLRLPYDRWHKSHRRAEPGDRPCGCGSLENPLYPSSVHGRGSRWRVTYTDEMGTLRRRNHRTWDQAIDCLIDTSRKAAAESPNRRDEPHTVSFYAREMIRRRRLLGLRESTLRQQEGHLRMYILPFAGSRVASSLTRSDSCSFRDYLTTRPQLRSASAVRSTFTTWKSLIHHMNDNEVPLPSNIVSRIKLPPDAILTQPYFTAEKVAEVASTMRHIQPEYEIAVWLAACAGLRLGEVLGLTWGSIDLQSHLLSVTQQVYRGITYPLKTESSYATLPIDSFLSDKLKAHRVLSSRISKDNDWVMTNPRGLPANNSTFGRRWREAVSEANLSPLTRFHKLRHFYISTLGESGCYSIKSVQFFARHKWLSTTLRYINPLTDPEAEKVTLFSSTFDTV